MRQLQIGDYVLTKEGDSVSFSSFLFQYPSNSKPLGISLEVDEVLVSGCLSFYQIQLLIVDCQRFPLHSMDCLGSRLKIYSFRHNLL